MSIDLETVATLIRSPDPVRLSYRRGIIERALTKKATTGVRVPDVKLYELKSAYLRYAREWCDLEDFDLAFPALRKSYYDGDSWIEPIRSRSLPTNVRLRHRLWTSTKDVSGLVDLIVSPATAREQERLGQSHPAGARLAPFSKGKGIQISFPVPEMRQSGGFDPVTAMKAFQAMRMLVTWYSNEHALYCGSAAGLAGSS